MKARCDGKQFWRSGGVLLVLFLCGAILFACSPVSTPLPPQATQAPEGQSVEQPDSTSTPTTGGSMRIAIQPIVQTDPALISSDSEILVASHVFDYLVDVDSASKIIPRLAREWTISPDGLTYTFHLEKDVFFHDGSTFGARDVIWTFNRLRDPASGFPTVDLYANIAEIISSSEDQVTFTLKASNPFFLYDLSDNHALILKENESVPAGFNGTGPFVVEDYRPEDRIVLKAYESYFLEGQPALGGVEIIFFNDDAAMVDGLRGGQIDLVMRLPTALYESLKDLDGVTTIAIPSNKFDLVRLRSDRAPGNDPRVIQALKLATDRQALFELVQQGYGAAGRDTPIGPMYKDYYSESTPLPARDVEKARELLSAAGYQDGLKLDLHTPDTENRPDLAAALKSQWAEAGIEVNLIVEPESVYYGDNGWLEVDLGITGWGSRPYPQFYLDVMLACGAKWNEAHWCDAEFDQLVKTAGTTLNEAERIQAYQEIQRILIERGPVIIPYFSATNAAVNSQFTNFVLKAFPGRTDLRQVAGGVDHQGD